MQLGRVLLLGINTPEIGLAIKHQRWDPVEQFRVAGRVPGARPARTLRWREGCSRGLVFKHRQPRRDSGGAAVAALILEQDRPAAAPQPVRQPLLVVLVQLLPATVILSGLARRAVRQQIEKVSLGLTGNPSQPQPLPSAVVEQAARGTSSAALSGTQTRRAAGSAAI